MELGFLEGLMNPRYSEKPLAEELQSIFSVKATPLLLSDAKSETVHNKL